MVERGRMGGRGGGRGRVGGGIIPVLHKVFYRPVGLLKLMLNLLCRRIFQGRELCWRDIYNRAWNSSQKRGFSRKLKSKLA